MSLRSRRVQLVLLITLLAGGVRLFAARTLYGDSDEPIYMKRAVAYANFMRSGQFSMLATYDETYEHPALYKILYGAVLLTRRPIDIFHSNQVPNGPILGSDAAHWIMADRYLSVFFGTLAATVLAVVNPLAGLFLAVHGLTVKYTSEVRLEALPLLTSILCMVTYLRWFDKVTVEAPDRSSGKDHAWLFAAAFFLGLTAASKYVYCVVGIAVAFHFVLAVVQGRLPWRYLWLLAGWSLISLVTFFAFDPYLWPDPVARLTKSLQYNYDYSHSGEVVKWGDLPWWQPVLWLMDAFRFSDPNPRWALLINIDFPVFLLAILGLPRLFRTKPAYFYWLVIAVVFLLVWNTKWSHYALIAAAPLCVAAVEGFAAVRTIAAKYLGAQA